LDTDDISVILQTIKRFTPTSHSAHGSGSAPPPHRKQQAISWPRYVFATVDEHENLCDGEGNVDDFDASDPDDVFFTSSRGRGRYRGNGGRVRASSRAPSGRGFGAPQRRATSSSVPHANSSPVPHASSSSFSHLSPRFQRPPMRKTTFQPASTAPGSGHGVPNRSSLARSQITCFHCGNFGHRAFECKHAVHYTNDGEPWFSDEDFDDAQLPEQ